jgi:hypothetical protein
MGSGHRLPVIISHQARRGNPDNFKLATRRVRHLTELCGYGVKHLAIGVIVAKGLHDHNPARPDKARYIIDMTIGMVIEQTVG